MRYGLLVGLMGLMVVATARAADGKLPSQPAGKPASATVSVPHSQQNQTEQQLARHQAEVQQLEQAVALQESDSKQASQRLQQQDQAIAELRKQLDALHPKPPATRH